MRIARSAVAIFRTFSHRPKWKQATNRTKEHLEMKFCEFERSIERTNTCTTTMCTPLWLPEKGWKIIIDIFIAICFLAQLKRKNRFHCLCVPSCDTKLYHSTWSSKINEINKRCFIHRRIEVKNVSKNERARISRFRSINYCRTFEIEMFSR